MVSWFSIFLYFANRKKCDWYHAFHLTDIAPICVLVQPEQSLSSINTQSIYLHLILFELYPDTVQSSDLNIRPINSLTF